MKAARKQRLYWVLLIVFGVSCALALILLALSRNIDFFLSPTQVKAGQAPHHHLFRLGGLVEPGSVKFLAKGEVHFTVTDRVNQIKVDYHGILPDLFKEGRAVIAQGRINPNGIFIADQVLAKHDNRYMPAQVKQALQAAKASAKK